MLLRREEQLEVSRFLKLQLNQGRGNYTRSKEELVNRKGR
jgi:hypothetical protein